MSDKTSKRPLEGSTSTDFIQSKCMRKSLTEVETFPTFDNENVIIPPEILELPDVMENISTLLMEPEDALVEAARTGDTQWLTTLLKTYNFELTDAMVAAATDGQFEVVMMLLHEFHDQGRDFLDGKTRTILIKAVIPAARNNHRDVVTCLLRSMEIQGEVSKSVTWRVLEVAAAKGSLDVVKFVAPYLIKKDCNEEEVDHSKALSRAIAGGHANVVAYLLRYPWNLAYAFMEAIEKEQRAVAERIYYVYPLYFDGKNLLVDMAGDGFVNAVKYMIKHGHGNSENIKRAFVKAAVARRTEVIDFLLGIGCISEATFDGAYEATASSGSIAAVRFLHDKRLATLQAIYRAFEKSGSAPIFSFFYKMDKLPAGSIIAAFKNVTGIGCKTDMPRKERETIASILYKEKCIPPDVICTAFAMTTHDMIDMVTVLYEEKRIPAEVVRAALQNAASVGHVKIVSFLMFKPEISHVVKQVALIGAARKNHGAIVQLISSYGDWSCSTLYEALKSQTRIVDFVSRQKQKMFTALEETLSAQEEMGDSHKYLYEHGHYDANPVGEAVWRATIFQFTEVVDFLHGIGRG